MRLRHEGWAWSLGLAAQSGRELRPWARASVSSCTLTMGISVPLLDGAEGYSTSRPSTWHRPGHVHAFPLWSVVHEQHSVTVSTSASVRFQHAPGAHVPVAPWVERGQLTCSAGETRLAQPHKGASRAAVIRHAPPVPMSQDGHALCLGSGLR